MRVINYLSFIHSQSATTESGTLVPRQGRSWVSAALSGSPRNLTNSTSAVCNLWRADCVINHIDWAF